MIFIYLLPYGKGAITFILPNGVLSDWITYQQKNNAQIDWLSMALQHPIDSKLLRQAAEGSHSAVILISDISRLSPSYLFAERLLDELNAAGINDDQIKIIVALGAHRKQSEEELISLVGPAAYKRVQVLNHSALPEDCIAVGVTRAGTPIEINRHVVEAEFRIVTGNIEPHRLAGISGGVKALMPGVASTRTIEHNHSLSQQHTAVPGQPDNPLRLDMEEALRFVPIHFLLNVIVDHERNVLDAFAGDVIAAHRAGIEAARSRFIVEVPHLYDVVLVSAGGHPKDTQLYQALKSLTNAAAITKPGGPLVLVAQCEELFGNGIFQHWIETISDRQVMLAKLKEKFVLGAHKIEHIDSILQHHPVYVFSQIPESMVRLLGFHPVSDLNHTLSLLLEGSGFKIAVMPYGGLTFPNVNKDKQLHRPK
jgi:nickel-dependent lactate racemase